MISIRRTGDGFHPGLFSKVILSSTTPPEGYYLPAAGDTMEIRRFIRTLENRGENTLRVLESARELLVELEGDKN